MSAPDDVVDPSVIGVEMASEAAAPVPVGEAGAPTVTKTAPAGSISGIKVKQNAIRFVAILQTATREPQRL